MKIPVIILNYNSFDDCCKCIEYIRLQQNLETDIIVVDNKSHSSDIGKLDKYCANNNITLIKSEYNRGYNAGNNLGLRYAWEKGYEFALIANPDMEFRDPTYIHKLVSEINKDSMSVAVGSDIVTPQGLHQNPMLGEGDWKHSFGWLKDIFFSKRKRDAYSFIGDYNKSSECPKLCGCAVLLRLEFLNDIGYFDEYPLLYCEEAIFSRQVSAAGKKMRYVAEVSALHNHVPSTKGDPCFRFKQWKRSRLYYINHYSGYPWYGKLLSSASWSIYNTLMILYFKLKRLF